MIEVKDLTKRFGAITAIDGITFNVGQGEVVGFLGPNGAGKSTTMRILTGFTPPTRGTAKVASYHVEDNPIEAKRNIGYMAESVPAYGEMIVTSFLSFVATVKGVASREVSREVKRVMERSGLSDMGNRVIRNLSKGYRQRLGLAQALIGNPPVLILDEPTAGLDPNQIVEIRQVIKSLAEEHTVLLSTHILPEVAMVCQRVIIIHKGRVVAEDTMDNLTGGSARTLEVEALGASAGIVARLQALDGVTRVTSLGACRYAVESEPMHDVREAVSSALAGGESRLVGLQLRGRTLEEVFVAATAGDRDSAA